jgi:hypothetical protein
MAAIHAGQIENRVNLSAVAHWMTAFQATR